MTTRLYNDDCLKVMRTFEDGKIDAIVTDPAYEVGLNKTRCAWDEWPKPEVWKEMYRVTKAGGLLAFTIAPHVAHLRVSDVFAAGWELLEVGFWVWGSGRPIRQDRLKRCYDLIYYCGKGTRSLHTANAGCAKLSGSATNQHGSFWGGLGSQFHEHKKLDFCKYGKNYHPANVACTLDDNLFGNSGYELIFAVKRVLAIGRALKKHPTKKPIDLMGQIIKLVSDEGDTILDPFMGDGTTGEAALPLGREFIGSEVVLEYYERAVKSLSAIEAQLRLPIATG